MLAFADPATWAADLPYVGAITGLTMLVVGAEVLVRGAVWIALAVGMSRMAVGLTLVSIGTSLPELLVTLTAADGSADLGMGNVLGSNVANVLLIIGATATIRAIKLGSRWFELGYMLLLTALASLPFVINGGVTRWLAGIMIAVLVLFLFQLLARERSARKNQQTEAPPETSASGWLLHVVMLVSGFVMLKFGADWLVDGASAIAMDLGMTKALVGVTVVAIGTSMPELATSVIAALRGQPEICVGNVIGSNIFNIGAVLGGAGLIKPFALSDNPVLPMTLFTAAAASLALVIVLRKTNGVSRPIGNLFLLGYVAFIAYSIAVCPSSAE